MRKKVTLTQNMEVYKEFTCYVIYAERVCFHVKYNTPGFIVSFVHIPRKTETPKMASILSECKEEGYLLTCTRN